MTVRVLNIVCIFVVSFWLFSPAAGFEMVEFYPLAEKAATMRWLYLYVSALLKLYLFFVLFISVVAFLRIRWFLMWNNYSWYVDSLYSLEHVCFTLFLLLLLLAASCCAHIFSVNWVRCLLEKITEQKLLIPSCRRNITVINLYHVCLTFYVKQLKMSSRTQRMLTASTRCDRYFACRKHFSLIKMLTKKKNSDRQKLSQSTPQLFAWQAHNKHSG